MEFYNFAKTIFSYFETLPFTNKKLCDYRGKSIMLEEVNKFSAYEYIYIDIQTDIDTLVQNKDYIFDHVTDNAHGYKLRYRITIPTSYNKFTKDPDSFRTILYQPCIIDYNWNSNLPRVECVINIDEYPNVSIEKTYSPGATYMIAWCNISLGLRNCAVFDHVSDFLKYPIKHLLEIYADLIHIEYDIKNLDHIVPYNNQFIDSSPIPGIFPPEPNDYNKIDKVDGIPEEIQMMDIKNYSASIIQLHWRKIIVDPTYLICRNRLMHEFEDLTV